MPESIELNFVSEDVVGGEVLQWATSFSNVNDLVDKAIAQAGDKCISRLVIAAHGSVGNQGFMCFDVMGTGAQLIDGMNDPAIPDVSRDTLREAFERLRSKWCPKAVLEVRVCEFGTNARGTAAMQALSDLAGVPVTAPMDEISSIAAIGGLTTEWKTVYPSDWGMEPEESFWRGDPETRPVVPMPGTSIASVSGSTVTAPITAPAASTSGIGWRRTAGIVGTLVAVGGGWLLATRGDSPPEAAVEDPAIASDRESDDSSQSAAVTEDAITEDAITEDAITEDAITEDSGDETSLSTDDDAKDGSDPYANWPRALAPKLDYLDSTFEWDEPSREWFGSQYENYTGIGQSFSDPAQLTGLVPENWTELSLRGGVAAYHWGSQEQTARLLGNSEFGCGELVDGRRTVCAGGAPIEGDYLIAIAVLGGEVPAANPGYQYTYSLVLDTDNDPVDNYQAPPAFEWDTYQGTDYWIELVGEGEQWQLLVTDWAAGDPRGTTTSAARAVLWGDMIIFFVPESDLGGTHSHSYRFTSFVTLLERAFDPAVSAIDAYPGPPDFGLLPISEQKLMVAE